MRKFDSPSKLKKGKSKKIPEDKNPKSGQKSQKLTFYMLGLIFFCGVKKHKKSMCEFNLKSVFSYLFKKRF